MWLLEIGQKNPNDPGDSGLCTESLYFSQIVTHSIKFTIEAQMLTSVEPFW